MEYLKLEEEHLLERIEKFDEVKELLSDLRVQNTIRGMYIEFWGRTKNHPLNGFEQDVLMVSGKEITLTKHFFFGKPPYEEVLGYEDVNFCTEYVNGGYRPSISGVIRVSRVVGDYTFILEEIYRVEIPKEELILLRQLGKISTESTHAYVSESVFCEFG